VSLADKGFEIGGVRMNLEDRVRGYACDAVGDCSLDRISAVSKFEAGDRHAVFRVSFVDRSGELRHVVVRASTRRGSEACVEAKREASVVERAAGVAAPTLYDVRCESRWFEGPAMCLQFLSGEQRDLNSATHEELEQLGSLMARVHRLRTDDLFDLELPNRTIAEYLHERHRSTVDRVAPLRERLPTVVRDRVEDAAQSLDERVRSSSTRASFRTSEPLALLHGDPGAANVIWTPEPVLIDWEYARLGDPADEVGYFFGQHSLTPEQRLAFWRGYGRSANRGSFDDIRDRARSWEPLTLLGSALWWLEHWSCRSEADHAGVDDAATPRSASYYLQNAELRLARLPGLLT